MSRSIITVVCRRQTPLIQEERRRFTDRRMAELYGSMIVESVDVAMIIPGEGIYRRQRQADGQWAWRRSDAN